MHIVEAAKSSTHVLTIHRRPGGRWRRFVSVMLRVTPLLSCSPMSYELSLACDTQCRSACACSRYYLVSPPVISLRVCKHRRHHHILKLPILDFSALLDYITPKSKVDVRDHHGTGGDLRGPTWRKSIPFPQASDPVSLSPGQDRQVQRLTDRPRQYRSNWVVDPQTGEYSATVKSPTGIASDPALASYGVQQAEQLGTHLLSLDPPVDLIYSSPFYRCLQTLAPFTNTLAARADSDKKIRVNVEPGVGEFYGLARFDHPSPASIDVLNTHFPNLHADKDPIIVPSTKGESIPQLHDRLAYALHHLIARADADPSGPKSLLICSHAAAMISIGRVLTGRMPEDVAEEDFNCFTCSFSKFVRKAGGDSEDVQAWDPENADQIPDVQWRDGKGVQGGWKCEVNGDCSFLPGGEERGWRFSGDESFLKDPNAFNDTANVLVEETRPASANGSGSRL
nr:uncharacterized protein CFP56_30940 [Quercus suber]